MPPAASLPARSLNLDDFIARRRSPASTTATPAQTPPPNTSMSPPNCPVNLSPKLPANLRSTPVSEAVSRPSGRPPTLSASAERATGLAILSAVLILTGGCTSKFARHDAAYEDVQPRSVSAREYGYVRPAVDIRAIDATATTAAAEVGFTASPGDPWQRIRARGHLAVPHHPRVDASVRQLASNKRYLNQLAARARPYLHLILAELERAGLPTSLALLPEIESRYNPRAVSPMRAAGMWQFMSYTGKEMGLEQNAWYDGRYDVLASTRGAIRYLRELHQTFDGDWALALAAYNAGPGRVQSAQRANERAGKPTDYWSLDLPQETEAYVPKFLAVAALIQTPERFGQRLPALPASSPLAVVTVRENLSLTELAAATGIPADTLKRLNPGLKKGRTGSGKTIHLLVPSEASGRLAQQLQNRRNGKRRAIAASDDATATRG